jgi:hypothetical protein
MCVEDDTVIVDESVKQNNVIEERNPDMELTEAYNEEVEDDEDEVQ